MAVIAMTGDTDDVATATAQSALPAAAQAEPEGTAAAAGVDTVPGAAPAEPGAEVRQPVATAPATIAINAFGAAPAWRSRIANLGGSDPAPNPGYAFHTQYVHCDEGEAAFTFHIVGLAASAGTLTVRINGDPHRHGAAPFEVLSVDVKLADLAAGDGALRLPFVADADATYAILGEIADNTDATAEVLAVVLERGTAANRHVDRLIAARETVFATPASPALAGLVVSGIATLAAPVSQMCTAGQFVEPEYTEWMTRLGLALTRHRKLWEFAYILQVLRTRGMLRPGMRGLGFGVGTEPLPAMMAAMGCTIVATDLPPDHEDAAGWSATNQHVAGIAQLRRPDICPDELFDANVSFRAVDMTAPPADLTGFDFTWSSCAYEHLGSIPAGLRFVENSVACLKPGGIAVHTTEFNLSSNRRTVDRGNTVLFRRRDLEKLAEKMIWRGHEVAPFKYDQGDTLLDTHVDVPPYRHDDHLKLALGEFVSTSFGITIRRAAG